MQLQKHCFDTRLVLVYMMRRVIVTTVAMMRKSSTNMGMTMAITFWRAVESRSGESRCVASCSAGVRVRVTQSYTIE